MPTLQLTRQGFAPEHAATTRNYLLAIMLWPAECDARTEFLKTCAVGSALDAAKAVPGMPIGPELVEQAWRVRKPEDFEEDINHRVRLGLQVGEFYAKAWQDAEFDVPFSVADIRKRMTSLERRALHPAVLGDKNLETVLREFRPSATLWAASFILYAEHLDHETPCRLDRIPEFLGMAERVRTRVSALKLRHQHEPLLPPSADVWRPPAWLKLPEVRLVPAS